MNEVVPTGPKLEGSLDMSLKQIDVKIDLAIFIGTSIFFNGFILVE
jgi:hypothetical protein